MIIRKATAKDLPGIIRIYDEIHTREETGEVTIGWIRGIYPTGKTAEESIQRGDMFVQVDKTGEIVGTGIINKTQVDAYADGDWQYPASDDEVMVLHTLIISVRPGHRGSGKAFLDFYESFAKENGCPYLRLDTNARNAVARAFYRKHGYDEIGIVPTVFNGIPGVDLVLLEKRLGDRGRFSVSSVSGDKKWETGDGSPSPVSQGIRRRQRTVPCLPQETENRPLSPMRIYVDYDDCLCETARSYSMLAAEMFGRNVPYEHIRSFDLFKSFGLNQDQYERFMLRGHQPEVLLSLEETPGASAVINEWIACGHEVTIITGRPFTAYEPSRLWLDEHGLKNVKLYCLNKYGRKGFIKDSDFSLEPEDYYKMTFDYAVEDSPKAFTFFEHLPDLKVLVFDRPWNRECEFPNENYKRCFDWKDIRESIG